MAVLRESWLQLTREIAEEPALPIIDPHHHLWDYAGNDYQLDEFLQDANTGHNIVASVFVECRAFYRHDGPVAMQPVGETEAVEKIANRSAGGRTAVAAKIVGHADLTLGAAVAPVLEAHMAASPGRFRGIRHICSWDESPAMQIPAPRAPRGLMLDASFRYGFACLEHHDLSFDAWQLHPQLPELVSLARAFPGMQIVANHIGGPLGSGPYAGRRDEIFAQWKHSMAELAACGNVVVKLGGLGMPRAGFGWEARRTPPTSAELAEGTAPYYLTCIELFGPERCMFESNFPVDKQSYSYCVVWNSFKRMTRDFSAPERAALFHDTAARVYKF